MDTMYNSPPTPAPPGVGGARVVGLVAILLVLVGLACLPMYVERLQYSRTSGEVRAIRDGLPEMNLGTIGKAFGLVARQIGPSVVHIDTQRVSGAFQTYPSQGQASGVIVDPEGYIVTNFHVVEGYSRIEVHLLDRRDPLIAEVVGVDSGTDLAVLKINADKLIAAEWGDSDSLEVGELVWAIGNPFGLDRTITFGIVSAKGRRGVGNSPYQEFLQTDAAVNPGNSGGPLVDITGKIVGINTSIIGPTNQGIGFAIPSSTAREVYDRLRKTGTVERGYLGVALAPVTTDMAKRLQLKDLSGALVYEVRPGSPAEEAGVEPGDVVIRWDGKDVEDHASLSLMVARTLVGSEVELVLARDGKEMTLKATVGRREN